MGQEDRKAQLKEAATKYFAALANNGGGDVDTLDDRHSAFLERHDAKREREAAGAQ